MNDLMEYMNYRYFSVYMADTNVNMGVIRMPDVACISKEVTEFPLKYIKSQYISSDRVEVTFSQLVDGKMLNLCFRWLKEIAISPPDVGLRWLVMAPNEHSIHMMEISVSDADILLHVAQVECYDCFDIRAIDDKNTSVVINYIGILDPTGTQSNGTNEY